MTPSDAEAKISRMYISMPPLYFQGDVEFSEIQDPPQNSKRRKGDMQQVPYCGSKMLEATVQSLVARATWRPEFSELLK